eukprot:12707774-Prorocentrum_lima.AAC.1
MIAAWAQNHSSAPHSALGIDGVGCCLLKQLGCSRRAGAASPRQRAQRCALGGLGLSIPKTTSYGGRSALRGLGISLPKTTAPTG